MSEREDARRAALLRLLEDWEAGRMTEQWAAAMSDLYEEGLTATNILHNATTLTPRGLDAARAIKERGE